RCVPLCVLSRTVSTAQPAPSGMSSGFSPGKKPAIWPTVFSCFMYSIFGPNGTGSEITSFSRKIDRSTKRRGIALPSGKNPPQALSRKKRAISRAGLALDGLHGPRGAIDDNALDRLGDQLADAFLAEIVEVQAVAGHE